MAHAYALSYGSLVGFKFFKRSYDITNPSHFSTSTSDIREYWSIYNLKKWTYNSHTETEFNYDSMIFYDTKDLLWKIQVTSGVHFVHDVTKINTSHDIVMDFSYSFRIKKGVKSHF